jgi:hypothetical protein
MILPRMKAASRLLLPLLLLAGVVPAAEVGTSFSQTGINTQVNFMMTNNDPGAIYNSAELRLETILAPVFDAIQRFKPGITTRAQVYTTISHSIQPSPIGEVYNKWFHNLDSNTGVTALYHQGIGFTTWQNTAANASQDMMALTLNLGGLLDFNGNSLVEAGERLLTLPALAAAPAEPDAGFVGTTTGGFTIPAAVARFAVAGDWLERGAAAAALGVQRSGADAVLSWQAQRGLSYELQTSLTLTSNPADWTPLSTQQRPDTPGPELAPQTHTHSAAFGVGVRFYRLRITVP